MHLGVAVVVLAGNVWDISKGNQRELYKYRKDMMSTGVYAIILINTFFSRKGTKMEHRGGNMYWKRTYISLQRLDEKNMWVEMIAPYSMTISC